MRVQLSDHFTYGRLLRFTLPSIVMMVFTSIYSVVDGLFVSNLVGKEALAAVNVAYPLTMIVGAFGFMLGTGGSAEVARTFGLGEAEKAREYFTLLVLVILGAGGLLTGVCLYFLEPLMVLMGADGTLMADCVTYGGLMLAGTPIFMLQTSFQSFLVCAERPRLGLWLTVGAGLTNMALDYVFIKVMGLGVAGAALATLCGYGVGGLGPLLYFALPNSSTLRLVRPRWYPRMLLRSCTNGSSELLTNLSSSLVTVLYNRVLMELAGAAGVAAVTVMFYINFVFVAAFIGLTMGVAPIFGYQYGAGNAAELRALFGKCIRVIGGLGVVMTLLPQILSGHLTGLFVGYDRALQELTEGGFRIFALSFLFAGVNIFGSGFFTALGDGLTSAILSFTRTLVFQCGTILLLPRLFGVSGVWWAAVLSEVFAACVTVCFFKVRGGRFMVLPD